MLQEVYRMLSKRKGPGFRFRQSKTKRLNQYNSGLRLGRK